MKTNQKLHTEKLLCPLLSELIVPTDRYDVKSTQLPGAIQKQLLVNNNKQM